MSLDLVGAVLTGVLGGRRKRSTNALRYLGGRGGGFINANTLMAAAGLAWGAYETWQAQNAAKSSAPATAGTGSAGPGLRSFSVPVTSSAAAPLSTTVRLLKLAVAAANADGTMSDDERASVMAQAKAEGAFDDVIASLAHPGPLAEIVAGVTDPLEKSALYVVAFTVIRADEQVSGPERIFLAQLASLLALDPPATQALEKTVADRIDAEGA